VASILVVDSIISFVSKVQNVSMQNERSKFFIRSFSLAAMTALTHKSHSAVGCPPEHGIQLRVSPESCPRVEQWRNRACDIFFGEGSEEAFTRAGSTVQLFAQKLS
jgi:hypothetical protein